MIKAEYIWLDGTPGLPQLRSKVRIVESADLDSLPDWGYDGGSTNQSDVHSSDLILHPVRVYEDPFLHPKESDLDSVLVLCEVLNPNGDPHATNTRSILEDTSRRFSDEEPWFGFEQEYTMLNIDGSHLAWDYKEHTVQGDYYCGVGTGKAYCREAVNKHLDYCLKAGIDLYGANAEVMPGQWEFQTAPLDPLKSCDDLWMARYLLARICESYDIIVSYHPKPKHGDWNGAGCHTNFSTSWMRESWYGILHTIDCLEETHKEHMRVYGIGNELRMTGDCETSDPTKFTMGELDRSCSIRIPSAVAEAQCGYIEDRRPAANIDPYVVCDRILTSVCVEDDS